MTKKYIDAEKLAKAIEDKGLDCSFALKMERLDTLALIDELQQEQPQVADASKMEHEVDLEKEIDAVWNPRFNLGWDEHSCLTMNRAGFESFARHFAEWGAIHLSARKEE